MWYNEIDATKEEREQKICEYDYWESTLSATNIIFNEW